LNDLQQNPQVSEAVRARKHHSVTSRKLLGAALGFRLQRLQTSHRNQTGTQSEAESDGMVRIDKLYFTLKEVAERWQVKMDDLAYLAENGDLRVSVRLYNVHLEEGIYELDTRDDHPYRIPLDQSRFSGLQDLTACDAHKAFRYGEAQVTNFYAHGDAYVEIIEPSDSVIVQLPQLLIRREERDRIEAEHDRAGNSVADGIAFQHDEDFRNLRVGQLRVTLGRLQGAVVKHLYEAARSGDGWCFGKSVLAAVGSTSKRMSDVFKSKPERTLLFESDGRGRYRFRAKLR
jgi:hypothetical protein